jgi:CRP/FNR family cyclic AMP-dependent transcriptional regulator
VTSTSDLLLHDVHLFAGLDLQCLDELLVPVELAPGDELWRQGHPADALYVIEAGRVAVTARLPGGRHATLANLGPKDVVGELALLDGGTRTAGVRAVEPTRLLGLPYGDYRAVVHSHDPGARQLRQRLIRLACKRLVKRCQVLAARLPGEPLGGRPDRGEPAPAPDRDYLLRLPFFRGFSHAQLESLLARDSVERVAAGTLLLAEGERAQRMFVTLGGAVEEVIRRRDGAIRVALQGPGRGFGYAALLAGDGAAAAAAAARERSVVLAISATVLEHELEHDPFAGSVERDIVAALRQAERPQARLAAQDGGVLAEIHA